MYILVMTVHVVVCIFLIIVVLLQSGKAADLAGAFGGMGSQTAFGPRGSATLLSKATTVSAVVFMFTSLGLSIMATRSGGGAGSTVLDSQSGKSAPAKAGQPPAPVKPGQPATTPAPAPAPVTGQAPAAGQPSVTLTDEQGNTKTLPLSIPKNLPAVPPVQQKTPAKK